MSAGRILGLLIAVAVVAWLVRSQGILLTSSGSREAGTSAPMDKARAAARATNARSAQTEAASRSLESPTGEAGGSVSENMTPEQVRALLGPPDSVDSATGEDGVARERWTYKQVGKTVVFENGIVVRVE